MAAHAAALPLFVLMFRADFAGDTQAQAFPPSRHTLHAIYKRNAPLQQSCLRSELLNVQ